jgi:hypothetical protein
VRRQEPDVALDVERAGRKLRGLLEPPPDRTWFSYPVSDEQLEQMTPHAIAHDFIASWEHALADHDRDIGGGASDE